MASRLLRRSGIAVGLVAEVLGWRADLVISVGIGQYHHEVDVLKEEWPGVQFIGCEPCEENAKNYPGMVHNVAISDYEGNAVLHVKKHHRDGSSLHLLDGMDHCTEVPVKVTTLDKLFPHPFAPDSRVLLWLDCEGSELAALRGGERFVQDVIMINVELTGKSLGVGWPSVIDVHRWLVGAGFWRQWIHTQRISSGQCDCIYVRPELFDPDYACDPWEIERHEEWKSSN